MRKNLVLVGNGMAGVRTLEELLKHGNDQYSITVIGAEPHPNYNRIMLSPMLASEKTIDDIILNSREWYAENNIELITGDAVSEISRVKKSVITDRPSTDGPNTKSPATFQSVPTAANAGVVNGTEFEMVESTQTASLALDDDENELL